MKRHVMQVGLCLNIIGIIKLQSNSVNLGKQLAGIELLYSMYRELEGLECTYTK